MVDAVAKINVEKTPTPKALAWLQGIWNVCCFLVWGLPIRFLVMWLLGLIIAGFLADELYPKVVITRANQDVTVIAQQISKSSQSSNQLLALISKHHLSWCFIVSRSDKVTIASKAYAPDLREVESNRSQTILWHGQPYYDCVRSLEGGLYLHAGYAIGPIMANVLSNWTTITFPAGYFTVLMTVFFLFCMTALFWLVSVPVMKLAKVARVLMDEEQGKVDDKLKGNWLGIFEIQVLTKALKELRGKYDRLLYERITKEHELKLQKQSVEREHLSISQSFKEHVLTSQKQITELTTRELEEEFLSSLTSDIDLFTTPPQLVQRILEKCNDRFPTSITHGAFLRSYNKQRFRVEASIGFDDEDIAKINQQNYADLASELFSSNKVITLDRKELRETHLDSKLDQFTAISFLPLVYEKEDLGFIAIYCDVESKVLIDHQRILRKVAPLASQALHRVILYQKELEGARTDALTGLHNKKYFFEVAPQILEKCVEGAQPRPVSFLMIDGDHFKQINDSYGHQAGDKVLQDLARIILQCTRVQQESAKIRRDRDYLIRFGGEEFLVIMEGVNSQGAEIIAERIQRRVSEKLDWSGCLTQFTVSIGIATYPADGADAHELVGQADLALYYVKEELGRNHICHSSQVPKAFRSQKAVAALGGELGIFDPSALLQSLANAQKSGVLTVQAKGGEQLWMLFENGKPVQAKLGLISGDNAVVEFISTFEEGTFHFQETLAGKTNSGRMVPLNSANTVTKSLDRLLIDSALAQDQLVMAKRVLPDLDTVCHPISGQELEQCWHAMMQHPDAPFPEEVNVMQQIWRRANNEKSLKTIFAEMQDIPLVHLWRGTALLYQYRILRTKAEQTTDTALKTAG